MCIFYKEHTSEKENTLCDAPFLLHSITSHHDSAKGSVLFREFLEEEEEKKKQKKNSKTSKARTQYTHTHTHTHTQG